MSAMSKRHGVSIEADPTVPVSMGRYLAARLPHCHARFFPDEGHFSLPVNHAAEILRTLVESPSWG